MLSVGQFSLDIVPAFLFRSQLFLSQQLRQILDSSLVVYCLRVPMRRVQRC